MIGFGSGMLRSFWNAGKGHDGKYMSNSTTGSWRERMAAGLTWNRRTHHMILERTGGKYLLQK